MEIAANAAQVKVLEDTQRRVDYLNGARDEWEARLVAGFPNRTVPQVSEESLSDENTRRENMYEDRGL